ncbi:hypothetical protein I4U23_010780 [Adineta vaga]|nr:hypothetical protein I4U23_010780 [Adineta vaga]
MDTVLLQKIQKAKILLQPPQSTITAIGLQQGIASYAQERVWFEEKLQNDSSTSLTSNNVVLPLVVKCGSISIERIRSSILTILNQHTILRTAFDFNEKRGKLMQKVQSKVGINSYSFEVTRRTILSTNEMVELIKNEFDNNFSDLDLGFVLRCHLVKMGLNDDYELLKPDDLIIFVFHQIVFDYNSVGPFITAFTQAYDEVTSNMTNLQYIDYTLYEQTQLASRDQDSNINKAKQFWSTLMRDYKPYGRNSSLTTSMHEMKKRSGRGLSATFNLDSYTVGAQIEFASLYNVSMFDLGLAYYFIFLYELNNGTINDLCVVCPTANRPLIEMKSIIGTFINMLPYRIRIDPNQSFINFVQRLHTLCADISEHDQLPYQLIMKDTDNSYLPKLPFHFRFDSIDPLSAEEMALESETKDGTLGLYIDGVWLHGNSVMANDLTLTMIHNHQEQKTQYIFECSTDCYKEKAAAEMCRHFEDFLSNFFIKSSTTSDFNNTQQSITSSSHLLSGIKQLSKANFEQQSIIAETSFSTGSNLKTDEKCSLAPKEDILKIASNNKLEDTINNIWHEVMHTELDSYKTQQNYDSSISTTTSFFSIASFAQERIFLDEQVRFSNKIAIYNELVVVRPVKGSLSMALLLEALRAVLEKNNILRTCLILDNSENKLKQCVTDHHQTFTFANEQTFETDNELSDLIYKGKVDRSRFDLSNGRIFDCQILRKQQSLNSNYDTEQITDSDVLIFGFHHTVCDRLSFQNFLKSLSRAYNNKKAYAGEKQSLQYIDYTVLERVMDMTLSREFWHSQLDGYNFKYPFPFTVDRHRLPNDQRSGVASTAQIAFDDDIASSFLNYASTHHLTFFQLGLAIFYVFLFKLSHGLTDLCVSCLNANRYKSELQDMIGMFVSTLPHRLQLDSSCSFDELVKHVRDQCLSVLEHSHYPLQHILADFHLNRSNVSFLETLFDFITVSPNFDQPSFDGIILGEAPLRQSYEVAKFDFSMTFFYNSTSDDHKLWCSLVCSSEIFDEATVKILSRRFNYLVEQLVSSNPSTKRIDTCLLSISNTDLILPEEANEIQNIDFCRQLDVLNDAPASYAQTRLWFKERSNPDIGNSQVPSYNMPFVYRLYLQRTLSREKLSIALQLIVKKHPSLHTALTFHSEKQQLMQQIINHDDNQNNKMHFPFIISTYETDQQLQQIVFDENKNSQLFDLSQGHGFRCHLVYHQETSSDDGLLSDKDLIIFNFHHAFFDLQSLDIFLDDLNQAYVAGQLCTHGENDETVLRYLDYALIEQQMSMSGASFFWLDTLHDCQLDRTLALPYDRYRLSNQQRTDRAISLTFDSDQHLSHRLLTYASTNNISFEHLILSLYFLFLYKITSGQKDLCIAIDTHGRYRPEFNSIIGVFVNTIPLRCQLHAHWSFIQFVDHVCEITRNSMKYSYYPLQHILNQHPHLSHAAFLHTSFEFIVSPTTGKHRNTIIIGDNQLSLLPLSVHTNENEIISKFDFFGSFIHNPMTNQLSCTMNASLDLFTCETIQTMTQRFHLMLHHLFSSNDTGRSDTSICELSFTMPHEQLLLQSLNNTQTISSPVTTEHCIHQTFVKQVIKHPQKLAVELDEQSLTYAELLHSAQILSLYLLNRCSVLVGDIVCQCVERSITMVIGIMAIEMTGSAYCPLSPRDPHHRLQSLAKQTHSRLISK